MVRRSKKNLTHVSLREIPNHSLIINIIAHFQHCGELDEFCLSMVVSPRPSAILIKGKNGAQLVVIWLKALTRKYP